MNRQPSNNNHNYDSSLENDEVWDALSQSPTEKASPSFTQSTVRAARLSQDLVNDRWVKILRPALSIGAITTALAISAFFFVGEDNNQNSLQLVEVQNQTTSEADWLNEVLLNSAIEEPDLFTDAEVIAMVF